jgi:hypothetical protein
MSPEVAEFNKLSNQFWYKHFNYIMKIQNNLVRKLSKQFLMLEKKIWKLERKCLSKVFIINLISNNVFTN